MYIACVNLVLHPKVSVYLLADFLAGNPVADYVARLHTWNVSTNLKKPKTMKKTFLLLLAITIFYSCKDSEKESADNQSVTKIEKKLFSENWW